MIYAEKLSTKEKNFILIRKEEKNFIKMGMVNACLK